MAETIAARPMRRLLEDSIGHSATDAVLSVATVLAHVLELSPASLTVDLAVEILKAAEFQAEVTNRCREEFSARPVFLSRAETEAYYEGFCNNTLWPLFHYFLSKVDYDEGSWASYERINRAFCDTVTEVAEPGDLVWVQ